MAYGKNANKARRAMRKTYKSKRKADQVFYALANKRGKGKSRTAKVKSAYKKKSRRRR